MLSKKYFKTLVIQIGVLWEVVVLKIAIQKVGLETVVNLTVAIW
jgi:hypothetical protein